MAGSLRRQVIVDADVLTAASEGATQGRAEACCRVLRAIFAICHPVVVTPTLRAEWDAHPSGFSKRWRSRLLGKGRPKKIVPEQDLPDSDLRRRLDELLRDREGDLEVVLKDLHLVEAAMRTDRVIISMDHASRTILERASASIPGLKTIVWANPEVHGVEEVLSWLRRGAKLESPFRLCPPVAKEREPRTRRR